MRIRSSTPMHCTGPHLAMGHMSTQPACNEDKSSALHLPKGMSSCWALQCLAVQYCSCMSACLILEKQMLSQNSYSLEQARRAYYTTHFGLLEHLVQAHGCALLAVKAVSNFPFVLDPALRARRRTAECIRLLDCAPALPRSGHQLLANSKVLRAHSRDNVCSLQQRYSMPACALPPMHSRLLFSLGGQVPGNTRQLFFSFSARLDHCWNIYDSSCPQHPLASHHPQARQCFVRDFSQMTRLFCTTADAIVPLPQQATLSAPAAGRSAQLHQ